MKRFPLSEKLFLDAQKPKLVGLVGNGGIPCNGSEWLSRWLLISVIQTVVYDFREASALTFPVQIRFAYTALLLLCQLSALEWLYWVPAIGTFAHSNR